MFCETFLQLRWRFEFWLFRLAIRIATWSVVARCLPSSSLTFIKLCNNSLIVSLKDILWDAFHAKDLYIEGRTVWQRIINAC
jgi:hypothetical protein